jgi:cellulose synthase/poly-beta-1,6-N-acetylglucosamine synthase-like glycosyltransferase/peptidoglycan/xylan/chitin deacetylase (PgdA/CDA1 family)/spore germination protein YaaH
MDRDARPPVFYDPHQRRSRWVKRVAQAIGLIASTMFVALIGAVLINPALPALGVAASANLPQRHHVAPPRPEEPTRYLEHRFRLSKRALQHTLVDGAGAGAHNTPPVPPPPPHGPELYAFFVNWDDTSFTSLKQQIARVDVLVPEWLHLADAAGAVRVDDPWRQGQVLRFIRGARPALRITPLINNFNGESMSWETEKLAAALANPAARSRLIANLLDYVQREHFAGVNIDFENLAPHSQAPLLLFMRELWNAFHSRGLEVSQSVPLDDAAFNYRELAKVSDALVLMAYDEHASETVAGPVASQSWFTAALERRIDHDDLDPAHVVVAIGSYGYDWHQGARTGTEISFQEALRTAQESEGTIVLDSASLNPTFDYYDDADKLRHVWFLDAVTAFNQLHAAEDIADVRGVALWRLGSEDPSIWQVFEHRAALDVTAAHSLEKLHYGYDIDYDGTGEVLQVVATPSDGNRVVVFDAESGFIIREHLESYPSPYVIHRQGSATNNRGKIALTFDDGPDPNYTPAILDILRQKQVHATFFVIGLNADLHPALLQRILDEGHEIGNHTFTHPDVSQVSREQFRLEINATERLFEARLGRRSLLFRPPYAEDIEPYTPDQVTPLLFTSKRGYYTIGIGIDPGDWQSPGTDAIVRGTLEGARARRGQVVLLHDSGGDRTQTVAALPGIIDGLRAEGFEMSTVSGLLGVTRDQVMPLVPEATRLTLAATDAGFLALGVGRLLLRLLFLLGILLGLLRLLVICVLALWQRFHPHRPETKAGGKLDLPACTVIIPAYNESRVIVRTIESILESTHFPVEIIVVDDGSVDDTYETVVRAFAEDARVKAYRKSNAGKASALNYGLARTTTPVIVALDADTVFEDDTIEHLTQHFVDPTIGAVAGNAKVGNRINVLTRWQALEYITSQNLDRRAFDRLNCMTVVPGAVGAWRRELVLEAGGFSADTLAEDADLTLCMLRHGTRVIYDDRAIAWTEAPDSIRGLLKQRFRWVFGTLQAAWKQRDALGRPRFGSLGLVALPNLVIFGVLFPLISPLMDLQMVLSLVTTLIESRQHPAEFTADIFDQTLFYYALFVAVDLLAATLAFLLERREQWWLMFSLPLQRFTYRQLMYVVAIRALLAALRGQLVGWGKLERKATVSST